MNSTQKVEALSLSCGFFDSPSVKAIEKEFGFKGSKLLLDILLEVASSSAECVYCKTFRERIALRNNVSERLVDMVVHRMVNQLLLRKIKHPSYHLLVFPSWNVLSEGTKHSSSLLYSVTISRKKQITSEKTAVISEETNVYSEKTHNSSILTQKKYHYGTTQEART